MDPILLGLALFFCLAAGHAVADYPLQGDFLARAKNHTAPVPDMPWPIALGMHALIHGGTVVAILIAAAAVLGAPALIPAAFYFGVMETVSHVLYDRWKCAGIFGIWGDQLLHLAMKGAIAVSAVGFLL